MRVYLLLLILPVTLYIVPLEDEYNTLITSSMHTKYILHGIRLDPSAPMAPTTPATGAATLGALSDGTSASTAAGTTPSFSTSSTSSSELAGSTSSGPNPYALGLFGIRSVIDYKLDLHTGPYSTWHDDMELQVAKFGLLHHLEPDAAAPPGDPTWRLLDLDIKSWILATISDELKAMVKGKPSARDVWAAIEAIFTGNKRARQMQLTTELLHQVQGNQPVASYCGRIKAIGDALADVALPQSDDALIVALIRGLHARHKMTAKIIQREAATISFAEAQNMLVQDETMEKSADRLTSNTALLSVNRSAPSGGHGGQGSYGVSGGQGSSGVSGGSSNGAPNPGSYGGSGLPPGTPSPNQGKPKRKRFSNHGGYGWSPPTGVRPWTGVVQAWPQQLVPPPRPGSGGAPGLLGPRPMPPQAYTMYAPLHPPAPYGGPAGFAPFQYGQPPPPPTFQHGLPQPAFAPPTAPSFEQSALIGALQDMSLAQSGGWYADSGASAHLSATQGPANPGSSSQM